MALSLDKLRDVYVEIGVSSCRSEGALYSAIPQSIAQYGRVAPFLQILIDEERDNSIAFAAIVMHCEAAQEAN